VPPAYLSDHAETAALIEAYRLTGRPDVFEQIVRRFAALVLSESRRAAGNSHDAEDASQLTFLALAMQIKSDGAPIERLGPWLARVSRRQALKIVRSRGRRRRREDAVRRTELQEFDTSRPLDQAITGGIVRDAIDQLPDRYRMPVVLHYFGGMSLEAIAGELKVTRAAVGTRLHRGRKMLGERLERRGLHLDGSMLTAAMAVVVPASVVAGVLHSTTATAGFVPVSGAAIGISASMGGSLPFTITSILQSVSQIALKRPAFAAFAMAAMLAIGSSGLVAAVNGGLSKLIPSITLRSAGDTWNWIVNQIRRPIMVVSSSGNDQTTTARRTTPSRLSNDVVDLPGVAKPTGPLFETSVADATWRDVQGHLVNSVSLTSLEYLSSRGSMSLSFIGHDAAGLVATGNTAAATSPVPEPGVLAAAFIAAAGFVGNRKRRG
jgi:RNA polymerase sigma factor (sigma-70 family)